MRANRINFTCVLKNNFSFHWIFPSLYSCKNKCNNETIEFDCSCKHTCLRIGNCCDDFEKECQEEVKKEDCKLCDVCEFGKCSKCKSNSFLKIQSPNECECEKGFYYDNEEDICLPNRSQISKHLYFCLSLK